MCKQVNQLNLPDHCRSQASVTIELSCVLQVRVGGSTLALARQIIVEALYINAGLDNGLEWWNGVWNGLQNKKKQHIFIAILNSTV